MITKDQFESIVFPWLFDEVRKQQNSVLFIERDTKTFEVRHWFVHRFDEKTNQIFVMKYNEIAGKPPHHKKIDYAYFENLDHVVTSFHITKSSMTKKKDLEYWKKKNASTKRKSVASKVS